MDTAIKEFLLSSELRQLVEGKQELVSVSHDTSVEDTLKLLQRERITAVPVHRGEKYIGLVTVFDILDEIVFGPYCNKGVPGLPQFCFPDKPVSQLIGVSTESQLVLIFPPDQTLAEVVPIMAEQSLHRVIVGPLLSGSSYRLLTQTDIIRWFDRHADRLAPVLNSRLEELGLVNTAPLKPLAGLTYVPLWTNTLAAFRKLSIFRVSALPIVDQKGVIVGNLSASDLKYVTPDKMEWLMLPVEDFLAKLYGRMPSPIVVPPNATLREAIHQATEALVHRVWVVDDRSVGIGIVSFTDIIRSVHKATIDLKKVSKERTASGKTARE